MKSRLLVENESIRWAHFGRFRIIIGPMVSPADPPLYRAPRLLLLLLCSNHEDHALGLFFFTGFWIFLFPHF